MSNPSDPTSALSAVPAAGDRRSTRLRAALKFFYGPMDCGKSTLALQINHNHARQGRHGLLLTKLDRSHAPRITSRIGLAPPRSRSTTPWTCANWSGPGGRAASGSTT